MSWGSVLVIGEALVDVVSSSDGSVKEFPGGSPANVALTLGRRGIRPQLYTDIGDDTYGQLVRRWLEESHVDIVGDGAPRTSIAHATIAADGSATYDFTLGWDPAGPPSNLHDIVHVGSIGSWLEPGAASVHDLVAARAGGALVTYDPNVRPSLMEYREPALQRILAMVDLADVVKVSDEDLAWIDPGVDPEVVARRWLSTGPRLVIVTGGSVGSTAFHESGEVFRPSEQVRIADTICAGDSFMGATIDWLLRHDVKAAGGRTALAQLDAAALADLLDVASKTAAITVSRPGADPPWADELR